MLNTTISDILTLDIQTAITDVKFDSLVRRKLLSGVTKLMDAEEDVNIAQQESLAHINDWNIKFGTFSSAKTSLDCVYKKWIDFCVKEDPDIFDDYMNNLTTITEELEQDKHKEFISNEKIMEYKCKAEECKELFTEYFKLREDYNKKTYRSHRLDEEKQLEVKEQYDLMKKAQKDFVDTETEMLDMLKNYESWRQNSMLKCCMNFILSNIEYHGKAVEDQSSVMRTFEDSEKDIIDKSKFGNRFLKQVPKIN